MKKFLSTTLVAAMLLCMVSAFGIFATENTTLNVDVDTSEMTVIPVEYCYASGISPWGGEEADKLFDGKYGIPSDDNTMGVYTRSDAEKGTKLGGPLNDDYVTVDFATVGASKISYYTFYTGFDSGWETDRNPIAWELYGMDADAEWQLIHKIQSSETVSTGMQPVNCTPYTYAVPEENIGEYTEYMFVFEVENDEFQLNEIVLFGEIKTGDQPGDEPGDEPADQPDTTTKAPATTEAPSTTPDADNDASDDSGSPVLPIVIAVAAVVVVAVVVVIVVMKKKKG